MAAESRTDRAFLLEILPALLETTKYLTGDTERAQRSRASVNAGFHARTHQDLRDISQLVRDSSNEQLPTEGHSVLRTLEDHIVKHCEDEDERESRDETQEYFHTFVNIDQRNALGHLTTDERLVWHLEHFKLECPSPKHQKRLTRDLGTYLKWLNKSRDRSDTLDLGEQEGGTAQSAWGDARCMFMGMQRVHQAVSAHLSSGCAKCSLLAAAKLSFPSAAAKQGFVTCKFARPFIGHNSQDHRWKFLDIQTPETDAQASDQSPSRARVRFAGIDDSSHLEQSSTTPLGHFTACELSDAASTGMTIQVQGNALYSVPEMIVGDTHSAPGSPFPLSRWILHSLPRKFSEVRVKDRMILALYLAYAYLHLGGGPVWPFTRVYTDVWLFEDWPASSNGLFPFAAIRPHSKDFPDDGETLPNLLNPAMPSLPVLGKLLLELFSGERLDWNNLDDYVRNCKELMSGVKIVPIAKACLDGFRKDGRTLQDDEEMKSKFLSEVVLKLQRVVVEGFGTPISSLFRSQTPVSNAALHTETSIDIRAGHTSQEPHIQSYASSGLNTFCLYDERDDSTRLDPEDANRARRWFAGFNEHVAPFFPEESQLRSPVKIAIIDTGVNVDSDTENLVFKDRVTQIRSWLTPDEAGNLPENGVLLARPDQDDDGHGTHAATSLFQITQHLNCEIYIARVFQHRRQKRGEIENAAVHAAVARAIDYAVREWKVDIISMAFGFPHPVGEIERAIERASFQRVLMFAAASNVAGNDQCRWPARHEQVICVHASDGEGQYYPNNPTPTPDRDNLSFLGTSVSAYWIPGSDGVSPTVHKSGTSSATITAVGIAATILDFAYRGAQRRQLPKKASQKQGDVAASRQRKDEARLQRLKTSAGMQSVMRLMAINGERQGYRYVCPWSLFRGDPEENQDGILQQIWVQMDKYV